MIILLQLMVTLGFYWTSCCTWALKPCLGTSGGISFGIFSNDKVKNLKSLYENCTHVIGNLEINQLNEEDVKKAGGTHALNFLNSIQEDRFMGVQDGRIQVSTNFKLCYWDTIDYRQILGESFESRIMFSTKNFNSCQQKVACSPSCTSCFGASPSQCQKIYRENCADQCINDMCFNSTSKDPTHCCHPECVGGCFGPDDTQCYGCRKMRNGERCVDRCPSINIYDANSSQWVKNPEGKYSYYQLCLDECPGDTVTYKNHCVSRCPDGYDIDDSRNCKRCTEGVCQKTCHIHNAISSRNVDRIANCTHVDGFIEIRPVEFYTLQSNILQFLGNVQIVTEYVLIESLDEITSLNFLRNLRRIEGRRLFLDQFAFVVQDNSNLKSLGTVSLRNISYGDVSINNNKKLCFGDELPWDEIFRNPISKFKYFENRPKLLCNESVDQICHKLCNSDRGCWGPGPNMCYECNSWKVHGSCIEDCKIHDGFYLLPNNVCDSCHQECLSCFGPGSFNCSQCRNVQIDGECVAECPLETHYLNRTNHTCEKCHDNCFLFGCTGPGNFVGEGGCKKCKYGVFNEEKKILSPCLSDMSTPNQCAQQSFMSNYFWGSANKMNYAALAEFGVCVRCMNVCRSCSSYGASEEFNTCVCNSHRIFSSKSIHGECANNCPKHFYNVTSSDPNVTNCYPCHPQCYGCYGPLSTDCVSCRKFKIFADDRYNCAEKCPDQWSLTTPDNICVFFHNATGINSGSNNAVIPVVTCAIVLICVAAITIFVIVLYRRKTTTQEEPYVMKYEMKPDLSKLRLILESELKKGIVLGYGAFGTVYRGVWMPPNETKTKKIPVAIKVMHDSRNAGSEGEMLDEASYMARLRHPNLLSLIGLCLGHELMLVTPLMPLGNLLEYVQNNKSKIGSSALLNWCTQIASGMAYLEETHLVHRDLAARNVLVETPTHVRITDFGLAKMLEYDEKELKIMEGKVPLKWLALECIQYRKYTHKSDVWAFGVTVWELLTFGETPYKDTPLSQIQSVLEEGDRLPQPTICTLDVYVILLKCWMIDPESRPKFIELKELFSKMLQDPGRYLVIEGDHLLRLPSYTKEDHIDIIRQYVDESDICEPEEYLHYLNIPAYDLVVKNKSYDVFDDEESTINKASCYNMMENKPRNSISDGLDNFEYLIPPSAQNRLTSAEKMKQNCKEESAHLQRETSL